MGQGRCRPDSRWPFQVTCPAGPEPKRPGGLWYCAPRPAAGMGPGVDGVREGSLAPRAPENRYPEAMIEATYSVTGMSCDHCVQAVKTEVGKVAGVASVDVDLAAGRV